MLSTKQNNFISLGLCDEVNSLCEHLFRLVYLKINQSTKYIEKMRYKTFDIKNMERLNWVWLRKRGLKGNNNMI